MPGPAWDDDDASARVAENLTQLALSIPAESIQSRAMPTAIIARNWHRSMLQGVEVPDDAYRGGFRGDAHPALAEFESTIGGLPTTRAASVGEEIRKFVTELQNQVTWLDEVEALRDPSVLDPDFVMKVLELAAWLHCEWVRIHPFVNGNGRTGSHVGSLALRSIRPAAVAGTSSATRHGIRLRCATRCGGRAWTLPAIPPSPVQQGLYRVVT